MGLKWPIPVWARVGRWKLTVRNRLDLLVQARTEFLKRFKLDYRNSERNAYY